ncbi:MAG: hypothetical protein U0T83_06270 [Bacteriovoracaceae bacterium]
MDLNLEFDLNQLEGIVKHYRPTSFTAKEVDNWVMMSIPDRAKWLKENIKTVFKEYRKEGFVELMDEEQFGKFLPKSLILDHTDNVELVLKPMNTMEEWFTKVSKINEHLGVGSMQGTLSAPSKFFLRGGSPNNYDNLFQINKGYFNFYNEYDSVEKLHIGYLRSLKNQNQRVARSFEHPFVGPITKRKQEILHEYLKENAKLGKYDNESMQFITDSNISFKYIGSTAYRPDIVGKSRVVLEVRDAHNNMNSLLNRMIRNTYFIERGREDFKVASILNAFDPENGFKLFPEKVQKMLHDSFPNKSLPEFQYTPAEMIELDVARNFSWPLRDWSNHVELFNSKAFGSKADKSKKVYSLALDDIADKYHNGIFDKEKAAVEVEKALAKFVYDTDMLRYFKVREVNFIPEKKSMKYYQYIDEVQAELGPLNEAFPPTIYKFPAHIKNDLEKRLDILAFKYPSHIRRINNVGFEFNGKIYPRDVVVVALKNINPEELASFTQDMIKHISYNSISFPLSEQGGHLYNRIGQNTFDFIHAVGKKDYSIPGSNRMETIISLNSEEMMNLRLYVDNAMKSSENVLGNFGYNGNTKGVTFSKLNDNRPAFKTPFGLKRDVTVGHNCTSWICNAPIGSNGEHLMDLVKAPREIEVHTNPGWWTSWLITHADKERVPVVIYWDTARTLDQIEKSIKNRANTFIWNFGAH